MRARRWNVVFKGEVSPTSSYSNTWFPIGEPFGEELGSVVLLEEGVPLGAGLRF